jgi:hypothetical protein
VSEVDPAVAEAFVEMAHRIVWATVATVDAANRPRSRILHPLWELEGESLTGVIATGPTPPKVAHLAHSPFVSITYWAPNHDHCTAECRASWVDDVDERVEIWERFKAAPEPVGYDPAIVVPWKDGPRSEAFGALRLEPWRLRVFPGTVLMGQGGEVLMWPSPR